MVNTKEGSINNEGSIKKIFKSSHKVIRKEHNVNLSKTKIEIKENKEKQFGDFSSNLAPVSYTHLTLPTILLV